MKEKDMLSYNNQNTPHKTGAVASPEINYFYMLPAVLVLTELFYFIVHLFTFNRHTEQTRTISKRHDIPEDDQVFV